VSVRHHDRQVQKTKILAGGYAFAGATTIGGYQGAVWPHGSNRKSQLSQWAPYGCSEEARSHAVTVSLAGAADDRSLSFKKSTIRRVLIDVESSHLLDSEK
jgi:hypothetical protein